ncbi:MAG: ATP-binding domain-containing protein [Deltaproteobacteria bacterium]|nr:ATP-binding domain-containing protein [Deltaproteobacteria bacterium]
MPNRVVAEELDLLAKISSLLSELPEAKTASEAPIVRELERLRAVILSGDEAKDISALTEQYHHQSAVLSQLRSVGAAARVDPGAPYFAHLRLREDGKERDLCLGRATCIERGIRIVDWRDAPISKIFYSYRQGDEYDEEIAGRERIGEVAVRRMVRIRGGNLERVQAPEGDFQADPSQADGWSQEQSMRPRLAGGEAVAIRAFKPGAGRDRRLGQGEDGQEMRADKHLPEITSLIDPTQFELIIHDMPGFLVIRGTAGSGKTTVALHRVAYLAFENPAIDGPETMVVVFSRALARFVGHVLPSLGLSRVRIVAYREWAYEQRRLHFPRLPAAQREDTPALIQRIKLHPFLAIALAEHVAQVPGEPTAARAIEDWSGVLCEPGLLLAVAEREAPGAFSAKDIDRFVEWHRRHLDEIYAAMGGDETAQAELDPEDDALLLRAFQLRVGPLRAGGKKPFMLHHLVVDEVQDFSPLEVQVLLGCMGEDASITLAGDTQQHVVQNSGFTSWSEFFRCLGIPGAEVETLRVSYRSSREIVHFASSVLGDLREDEDLPETPRTGPPVELFRFTDRGVCVAFIADALRELHATEPLASVAILTPSTSASAAYYEGLERCELPRLSWVREQDFSFAAGVEITEIEQVKGLEFDYVILVDVDATQYPDSDPARRLLHVGATRAIHQLWLTSVGTPSILAEELWRE